MDNELSGRPPSIVEWNLLMYGHPDPDMAFLDDPQRRNMLQNYLDALPKALPAFKGTVMVYGTAGDFNAENLKDVFCDPQHWVAGVDPYGELGEHYNNITVYELFKSTGTQPEDIYGSVRSKHVCTYRGRPDPSRLDDKTNSGTEGL